jgi:hypothetical protein
MKKSLLKRAAKIGIALGFQMGLGIYTSSASAIGNLADVAITDRSTGQVLPVYTHDGEYWVAGAPGNKYSIRINNNSRRRMLAVTSVDGVNVVSGETAAVTQSGYVFSAFSNYAINGWRKSHSEVAAFEFTASSNSYAERTGRPKDVGVIGVAVFLERLPQSQPQLESKAQRLDESSADRSKSHRSEAPAAAAKLGTAHGAIERSYASNTEFHRASKDPAEIIRIRYDSTANLVAMGVIAIPHHAQPKPSPFPLSNTGFVPNPPL